MPEAAAPDSHLSSLTSSLKVRLVVKLTLTDVDLWTLFFYPGQDEDSAWNIQQTAQQPGVQRQQEERDCAGGGEGEGAGAEQQEADSLGQPRPPQVRGDQ